MKKILFAIIAIATLASCGSSQKAADGGSSIGQTQPGMQPVTATLIQKVHDNAVYAQNIVASIDFTMSAGGKAIKVGGKLCMRKDDVIRIQLIDPILGIMEVGRLEFTKDYVLIQDKIHKQYIKEDYNGVSFLQENGLDFHALQALLWNQLYVPGTQKITESSLKEFEVKPSDNAEQSNITLSRGGFTYKWLASNQTALIENVDVNYKSQSHGSTSVNCKYGRFVKMGSKQFPSDIQLSLQTTAIQPAKSLTLGFSLSDISNSDKWETRTTPSDKYRQISVEEMLGALMTLAN